jgi:hypothetical protein
MIIKKYNVALNEQQLEALQRMMKEDMQTNVSQYFGFLIAEVSKSREGFRNKRAVGRPKKEGEKEVEWFPAPYDKNAPPYTMDDLTAYYTFRSESVPEGLVPLTKEELKKWDM